MPQKASAPAKKTGTAKATKSRVAKGDAVVCEVCGLSVVVEEVGGIAVSEETTLVCCGKPMKARKSPRESSGQANQDDTKWRATEASCRRLRTCT